MPLTLYSFIINRKSGFVKAFLRSRSSSAKQTILIAATICRRGVAEGALPYARGRFLVEAAIGCEADDSYVSDDLPQLPALLTSVSNSIAGSVLPPSLGRGGASLAEGATHLGATCFFFSFMVYFQYLTLYNRHFKPKMKKWQRSFSTTCHPKSRHLRQIIYNIFIFPYSIFPK